MRRWNNRVIRENRKRRSRLSGKHWAPKNEVT